MNLKDTVSTILQKEVSKDFAKNWANDNFNTLKSYLNSPNPLINPKDKVYYLPKISGFNNKKPLEIETIHFNVSCDLCEGLEIPYFGEWLFSFKNSYLTATQKQISVLKPF